jgi:hypothetical protein
MPTIAAQFKTHTTQAEAIFLSTFIAHYARHIVCLRFRSAKEDAHCNVATSAVGTVAAAIPTVFTGTGTGTGAGASAGAALGITVTVSVPSTTASTALQHPTFCKGTGVRCEVHLMFFCESAWFSAMH